MYESFRRIEPFRNLTNSQSNRKESSGFKIVKPVAQPHFVSPEKTLVKKSEVLSTAQTLDKTKNEKDQEKTIKPFVAEPQRARTRICKLRTDKVSSKKVIFKNPKIQISFEIVNLLN